MTSLVIKDVSPGVLQRLERRARAHGRSVEEESRAILEEAPEPAAADQRSEEMGEWLATLQNATWLRGIDPDELRDRDDPGRSAYVSPEGLDRMRGLLKRD